MGRLRKGAASIAIAFGVVIGPGCVPAAHHEPSPFDGLAARLLAQRPFRPANAALFGELYSTPDHPDAPAPGKSDGAIRAELRAVLVSRFGEWSARVATALALLDDAVLQSKVVDLNLRAALISLSGTPFEPVIASYRDDPNLGGVRFADTSDSGPLVVGRSRFYDGVNWVEIKEQLRADHYLDFSWLLVHERLHSDLTNSDQEEVVNRVLHTLARFDALIARPELAANQSWYTQYANVDSLVRLNLTDGVRMRVLGATTDPIPGSPFCAEFCGQGWQLADWLYDGIDTAPSPGTPLLDQILTNLAEPGNVWTSGGDFGQALEFLDHNYRGYGPAKQLQVALALQLDVWGAQGPARSSTSGVRVSSPPPPTGALRRMMD